ncbi:hypothetical protein [Streptomyces sp. NBC_00344]|uniref:hypothetical protein n=1 Tax=Streptomyces sp. NBC_00344 TaxID=2975720 RepID=UPI002E1DCCFE
MVANDDSQSVEMLAPDTTGFYSSNLLDWVPLCPQLRDSAIRLYWIMRALVIEKHGPVRKLTLLQLCYLLPAKPAAPGETVKPSSLARIRSLLDDLTKVGLVTTPDGKQVKTSSRANASAGPLRLRINDRPFPGYAGPRNAFAALDSVRPAAADAATTAIRKEAAREAARKAAKKAARAVESAGQISGPHMEAGQISSPSGQISSPSGQISSPDPGSDLQDRVLPFSPSTQSSRSRPTPVRPSVSVGDRASETGDGGTDGRGVIEDQEKQELGPAGGRETASASAAPINKAATEKRSALVVGEVAVTMTPGMEVLRAIAAEVPEWTLTGSTLLDQGRTVTGMLAGGFTAQEIRHVLVSKPLPEKLTHSVGAIVGRRLQDLLTAGPASRARPIPAQSASRPERGGTNRPTPTPPPVAELQASLDAVVRGETAMRCCVGDGGLCDRLALPGETFCSRCLHGDDPVCAAGCGRAVTAPGAHCIPCVNADQHDEECPGHDEQLCGRPVQTVGGLCWRCEAARTEPRRRSESNWREEVAEATTAAAAATLPAASVAPF